MSTAPKLTFLQRQHLVSLITDALVDCRTLAEIRDIANNYLQSQGLELHDKNVMRYVSQARNQLRKPLEENREKIIKEGFERLHRLYRLALKQGDTRAALAVEKEILTLKGLYKDLDNAKNDQNITIVLGDAKKEEDSE